VIEHLVAQVAQTHPGVALGVGGGEMRQDCAERHVRVVVLLELEQGGKQGAPLRLGHANGEQEENRKILRLLVLEAMSHEIG